MKRKPTAQSIRVGQTLYYVAHPLATSSRRYVVGSVQVKTDALPLPPDGQAGPYPRRFVANHLREFPGDMHYSRRVATRYAKNMNAEMDRVNAQVRQKVRALHGLLAERAVLEHVIQAAAQ